MDEAGNQIDPNSMVVSPAQIENLAREFPEAILMSARNSADVERLKRLIREHVTADLKEAEVLVPYDDKSGLLGEIRRTASVTGEKFEETGVRLTIRTYPETLAKLKLTPK